MDAEIPVKDSHDFRGRQPAIALCGILLLAFGAIVAAQWLGPSRARLEQLVQLPVPEDAAPAPHSQLSAPDPGDNP